MYYHVIKLTLQILVKGFDNNLHRLTCFVSFDSFNKSLTKGSTTLVWSLKQSNIELVQTIIIYKKIKVYLK